MRQHCGEWGYNSGRANSLRNATLVISMKLETSDGLFFSLTVESYEFPDEDLGPTEDNPADDFDTGRFLVVSHTFRNADGEWRATAPSMTTTELQFFADWLDSVRRGSPIAKGAYFTERDLEFSVDDESNVLHVHLFWDFRPEWVTSEDGLTLSFPLNQVNLDEALRSLREQIAAFPGRPPISSTT